MSTKQTCLVEFLGLEALGASQPHTKLAGHAEDISKEVLVKTEAFDSVFLNFAQRSPVSSAARLVTAPSLGSNPAGSISSPPSAGG